MDSYELKMVLVVLVTAVLIIGGGVYLSLLSEKKDAVWTTKCEQAGGVASKYETMVGKTSHSERLCIKKENVVEVER